MSFFINKICQQNEKTQFYYYTINCDIVFENTENLKRLYPIEKEYSSKLINGYPPENLLNNYILSILLRNKMEREGAKILSIEGENILFVNTWCVSSYLNHNDFDIMTAIQSYLNLIYTLNNNFNLSLNFHINHPIELIDKNYNFKNNLINIENNNNTIFIFNYKPRSINFNMDYLNNYIKKLSENNNVILSTYNSIFDNINNIKFIDKDYNIFPVPSCKNLFEIWEIAITCKKIIILPSGASWTFLHKINEIKKDQIYMFNDNSNDFILYVNRLNQNLNILYGVEKNIINKM